MDKVTPHIKFVHDTSLKTLPLPAAQALQHEAKQLYALQEAGIIRPSFSEWACPMLMVQKGHFT